MFYLHAWLGCDAHILYFLLNPAWGHTHLIECSRYYSLHGESQSNEPEASLVSDCSGMTVFVHHFSSVGLRRKIKKAILCAGLTGPGSQLCLCPICSHFWGPASLPGHSVWRRPQAGGSRPGFNLFLTRVWVWTSHWISALFSPSILFVRIGTRRKRGIKTHTHAHLGQHSPHEAP